MLLRYSVVALLFQLCTSVNAQKLDKVLHIPGTTSVSNLQFSRDGAYFLALEHDILRVWETASGKQLGATDTLGSTIGYAAFMPGDSTILTVGYAGDSACTIWNWRTGALVRSFNLYHAPTEASLSGDGRYLALRFRYPERQYDLWDVTSGTYSRKLLGDGYTGVTLAPRGDFGFIKSGTVLFRFDVAGQTMDSMHVATGDLFRHYISRDGHRVGYSRSNNPPLVLDGTTLDSLFSLDVDMSEYTRVTMDISNDDTLIATITTRRTGVPSLDLWSGIDGRMIAHIASDSAIPFADLRISPNNDYVAAYNTQAGILIWPIGQPSVSVPRAIAGIPTSSLNVYPNPATTEANAVWYPEENAWSVLRVYDATGALVHSTTVEAQRRGQSERLPVARLANGTYCCVVESSGRRLYSRFIVEH